MLTWRSLWLRYFLQTDAPCNTHTRAQRVLPSASMTPDPVETAATDLPTKTTEFPAIPASTARVLGCGTSDSAVRCSVPSSSVIVGIAAAAAASPLLLVEKFALPLLVLVCLVLDLANIASALFGQVVTNLACECINPGRSLRIPPCVQSVFKFRFSTE